MVKTRVFFKSFIYKSFSITSKKYSTFFDSLTVLKFIRRKFKRLKTFTFLTKLVTMWRPKE